MAILLLIILMAEFHGIRHMKNFPTRIISWMTGNMHENIFLRIKKYLSLSHPWVPIGKVSHPTGEREIINHSQNDGKIYNLMMKR